MTKLSFLIYLADVASTANGWAVGFGIVFGNILIILAIVAIAATEENDKIPYGKKPVFFVTISFMLSIGASVLIPSQKTIYLIAGVEAAKELSSTEVAKEAGSEAISVMKDVTSIIHSYAKRTKEDITKKPSEE